MLCYNNNMQKVDVLLIDTNKLDLEDILKSSYLTKKDLDYLSNIDYEETKKEKAASIIFKNKYIKEYHLNEYGKPLSDDIYFNISHSKGYVAFVKDSLPIGIDIEKIREVEQRLIGYISNDSEKEYIKDDKSFFEIWTNKESLSKAIGVGVFTNIKDIPSLPLNGEKHYDGRDYFSNTIQYKDLIISVTRESKEEFEIDIRDSL